MELIFRINYRTVPGQSIWLKWTAANRSTQVARMEWLNEGQWQVMLHQEQAPTSYHYQLHQENGVVLDEWHSPRTIESHLAEHWQLLFLDTWCSASTVDYAFESKVFDQTYTPPALDEPITSISSDNYAFRLRMAAVPSGKVPCLLGNVDALGNWDHQKVIPLHAVSPNLWQVNLHLPEHICLEYKYGLADLSTQRLASIELGENRTIHLTSAPWTRVSDEGYRRSSEELFCGTGVAIPVFSLRSDRSLGVGEFADLKPLADWARNVGIKLIQILPINDTTSSHDWTDSYPYSAISVNALHPIYLRIDDLNYPMPCRFISDLKYARAVMNESSQLDYEAVVQLKNRLTRQIYEHHHKAILASEPFYTFLKSNGSWILPYAVFCVKRDHYGTADFNQWEDWATYDAVRVYELMDSNHPEWLDIAYHIWLQCELDLQLLDAVAHLHEQGIVLKGDLPIGIDRRSVDAWSAPHLFKMHTQAGAPPDAFAVKGQNWGFPTYDWEVMQRDGYAWWRSRFEQLSRYFDAYRIDHILGFFRIWQIPYDQVEGIMGVFDPAQPITIEEIHQRGIEFSFERYCRPRIHWTTLLELFKDSIEWVKQMYFHDCENGYFLLKEEVATQRKIVDHFENLSGQDAIRDHLLNCASEVIFFEVPESHGTLFHPRCSVQETTTFQELEPGMRERVEDLYNDYFYQRQEGFWQAQGYAKLPAMRHASRMLLCGEDLGMVPACVPGVMQELGILSLEIQRMPKTHLVEFYDPRNAPYLSVVSPSTHDMSTLREWWREDPEVTARFAASLLGIPEPEAELSGKVAEQIISQHLESPAMWAIFPLQDLLAMDETIRHPRPEEERINVPAITPFNWRYRMHLTLEKLKQPSHLNGELRDKIREAGR